MLHTRIIEYSATQVTFWEKIEIEDHLFPFILLYIITIFNIFYCFDSYCYLFSFFFRQKNYRMKFFSFVVTSVLFLSFYSVGLMQNNLIYVFVCFILFYLFVYLFYLFISFSYRFLILIFFLVYMRINSSFCVFERVRRSDHVITFQIGISRARERNFQFRLQSRLFHFIKIIILI